MFIILSQDGNPDGIFRNQGEANACIKALAEANHVCREGVGFSVPSHGYCFGNITFSFRVRRRRQRTGENGQPIMDANNRPIFEWGVWETVQQNLSDATFDDRGHVIPDKFKREEFDLIEPVEMVVNDVEWVLAIEDFGTYRRLLPYAVENGLLLVYLGGQPDVATRAFLRRLEGEQGIRGVGVFVDMDLGGIKILCAIHKAGARTCLPETIFVCSNPRWVGVRPSQTEKYNVPTMDLSQAQKDEIQKIHDNPDHALFQSCENDNDRDARKSELREMIRLGIVANTALMPENELIANIRQMLEDSI